MTGASAALPMASGGSVARLAVFGARVGSLGEAVVASAAERGAGVVTVGRDNEDVRLDKPPFSLAEASYRIFRDMDITDAFITIGVNKPGPVDAQDAVIAHHFYVNVRKPLAILAGAIEAGLRSCVVVSSNSAHIPRTNSVAYCASKAALSMAWRVAARENEGRPLIYGYEPGLLGGTPMTDDSAEAFDGALHRIKGLPPREGLSVDDMADLITHNLLHPSHYLNGTMIRLDGGEL